MAEEISRDGNRTKKVCKAIKNGTATRCKAIGNSAVGHFTMITAPFISVNLTKKEPAYC